MNSFKILIAAGTLVGGLALAAPASAQHRGGAAGGRAVPRAAVPRGSVARVVRPGVVGVVPYRPYFYRPGFSLGFYYGYPYFGGDPYFYGYPVYGYPAYGYPGYGYGYGVTARPYGGVRLSIPQREAEVYADGYFVGTVDDFDGNFQHLTLEAGPHHIEVREQGFETIGFDVNIEPGQTITYRAAMRPGQP